MVNGHTKNLAPSLHVRLATGVALLSSGLLAGAFLFGWATVAPTFAEVPLEVHLTYRVELMKFNGTIMPPLMVITIAALIWFTAVTGGSARACAAGAIGLAIAALLTTMFGNVPINGQIKEWATGSLPADYQETLSAWGTFHDIRFTTAVGAFVLLIVAAGWTSRDRRADSVERRAAERN
ncbi:DUF1772 domain-containing protein [Brevibacterium picturae]|uniref:DUF1772 domain-containing protein n=1 Tax=Brevibacterium picturae TaxID=260553 RepID=A0ABN2BZ28_9MICO